MEGRINVTDEWASFPYVSANFYHEADGVVGETVLDAYQVFEVGGIKIALGEDGFYHELRADGSLGSLIYADFTGLTTIFSHSLKDMIDRGAFNFAVTESDQEILNYRAIYGDDTREKLKEIWGEQFDELAAIYQLDEVLEGKTHGMGEDLTAAATAYLERLIGASEEHPELEGCVAVDEALAELLQALMDKYTFSGVDFSWAKLCYYYLHLGA